ncbi:PPC domain-containing DNA-binding protein [Spirosoma sp. KUDC1026]|uniref:PPC domain-containing DNA-binding protein n=1 Tax=Spirosoma sp. KUDC1026 TaxID=2745947 RepID=UPI00159BE13B|nr:PPC domain-containing DNA-binding protein [Spirosoma sp. KUDC1026]QKZ13240.1 DNA-binding protein [Spirosoma sp. KUDC1026]
MKAKLLNEDQQKTYALIFDKGDEVMAGLRQFASDNHLSASQFTAIGGFSDVVLGFYDVALKDYKKIPVGEQVEVLTLAGDITLKPDGDVQVHAHAVIGMSDGMARGGHLLSATVFPTLEVVLTESPAHLRRQVDEETGIALIRL